MTKKALEIPDQDEQLLTLLEKGVKDVLTSKRSNPADRLKAVDSGIKLLAIRHKIGGGDEGNFFDK